MRSNQNRKWLICLSLLTLAMFGFGFALVPIYNSLCKTLGINGKVVLAKPDAGIRQQVDTKRKIVVEFVASNNNTLQWFFYPKINKVMIHPGETAKLEFYAENKTSHRMIVQAIPSITPGIAAKYLKKTECFCFQQQQLNGHEAMNMPLIFHVDTDLPENIKTITLAYTLFDVTDRL
jgi:cytochrome c oxidase assembly protein subunit 11